MNLIQRSGLTVSALALGSLLTVVALPATAAGEATVTVTNVQGAQALISGGTTLTLTGSGFQSVKGGQGGIYVAFGWVDNPDAGTWGPSAGGQNGQDYRFAPDTEEADNAGFLKFVSFPGGATSAAANGGLLAEDGTWATELAVPTAEFESTDRDGNPTTVNCLEVQCGVVTIGAHNIKNANNETFTPVEFVAELSGDAGAGSTDQDGAESAVVDANTEDQNADQVDQETGEAGGSEQPQVNADGAPENADTDGSGVDQESGGDKSSSQEAGSNLPIIFGGVGAALVIAVVVARQVMRKRLAG